jgi:hypothetical protein
MAYTANLGYLANNYINSRPSTYDYLRPNAFRFSIKDLPNTSFTCQSANLPSISLGFAVQPTPFTDVPRIGDKVNFGEFTIRFLVSEDMSNYLELYTWLIALGFPSNYTQYSSFVSTRQNRFPFITNNFGKIDTLAYSDGTLTILDSTNNPKTNIIFKDLFPISLEALDFDISTQTLEYFTAIASFKYTTFDVEPL